MALQTVWRSPLLDVDPLLTMRSNRQPVATGSNGLGLILPFPRVFRFATSCHWLRPLGSINAPYPWPESLMRSRIRPPSVLGTQADPFRIERVTF